MHELQGLVFFLQGCKVSEVLDQCFLFCSQLSNLFISLSNASLSLLFQFAYRVLILSHQLLLDPLFHCLVIIWLLALGIRALELLNHLKQLLELKL